MRQPSPASSRWRTTDGVPAASGSATRSRGTANSRSSTRSLAPPAARIAHLLPALRVQLLQVHVEAVEALVPERSIRFRPRDDLLERRGLEQLSLIHISEPTRLLSISY